MLSQLQAGCLSLARVIEDGVAKNEAPSIIRQLPEVLKQVCRRNHDVGSKSMIMVLLFSARTACKLGWFPDDDARHISILADEMATNLCGPNVVGSNLLSGSLLIPTIMSRFCPSFSLGKVLDSLEVSPGYGTYFRDFHILRDDFSPSARVKIRLLIARADMLETALCLVSPPQVSFLVNGAPVRRRTCIDVIPGPQLPTDITAMLRYGTNLLQAVGKFDSPCVMVIASMSEVNAPDSSSLLPYVPGLMVNLTDFNDQMDVDPVFGSEDRKHLLPDQANANGVAIPKLAGHQDSVIAGSLNMSLQPSNTVVDVPASSSASQVDLLTANLPLPPSLAVTSHCGQSIGDYGFQETLFPAATAESAPLPPSINANVLDGEYGHIPNLRPMNITRVPIAVQALPAQPQARMSAGRRARNTMNQSIPNVPPVHYFQQQHMIRPYAEVTSSYGPSATMFSHSYCVDMQQYLNQYTSTASIIHPPTVGQPCHMNIQNSLNSVDQQASPITPNSSGHASYSAMISEQPMLPLGRMRGSLSGQALENLRAHVILPTQIATPSGQSSGHPPGTQQPTALPQSQKNS
ncbi:hypothetical protein MLD38_011534 [Melastoma candidum]|uniref:Uncharacterized protein n=1 Tax=Melastoma candidum TaxID=119954 RepID=A0ACB9R302_9MYRT|nr:hypothetical protein MLD38_011534 [Melastoma candidum]